MGHEPCPAGAHTRRIEPSTPQREWVTGPVRALVRNIQCLLNTYNVQQKNLKKLGISPIMILFSQRRCFLLFCSAIM